MKISKSISESSPPTFLQQSKDSLLRAASPDQLIQKYQLTLKPMTLFPNLNSCTFCNTTAWLLIWKKRSKSYEIWKFRRKLR